MLAWTTDYADPAGYFEPLLNGANIGPTDNLNAAYFDDPRANARIAAAEPATWRGTAQGLGRPRRRPDAQQPTLGAVLPHERRDFVSQSYGCFLYHPFYGVDFAAACKK